MPCHCPLKRRSAGPQPWRSLPVPELMADLFGCRFWLYPPSGFLRPASYAWSSRVSVPPLVVRADQHELIFPGLFSCGVAPMRMRPCGRIINESQIFNLVSVVPERDAAGRAGSKRCRGVKTTVEAGDRSVRESAAGESQSDRRLEQPARGARTEERHQPADGRRAGSTTHNFRVACERKSRSWTRLVSHRSDPARCRAELREHLARWF